MRPISLLRTPAEPSARLGDVGIAELRMTRHTVLRPAALVQDSTQALTLLFVLSGELRLQGEQTLTLGAMDWVVCGAGPGSLSATQDVEAVLLTLPAVMPAPARDAVYSAAVGMGLVLLACIRSALKAADGLTPQGRVELGSSLEDLARLALREQAAPVARVSGRRVMRDRVKAFVRQRLRDSTLSIDDIAQTFNCTKRYLHKVFSEDERSLNQYIWELRLDRCSRDLASAELLDCSITRIAYLWGFRSATHFSRAFRQRFGVSPSLYRSKSLRAGPRREPAAQIASRRSIAPYVEGVRTTSAPSAPIRVAVTASPR